MNRNAWVSFVVASLDFLQSHQLCHFPPETDRWIQESFFVGINGRPLPHEVGFVRLDHLSFLDELPDQVEWRDEKLHGVVREEIGHIPWQVAGVAVNTGDHDQPDEREPGAVWLEPPCVRKLLAVQALRFAGSVEEDVGDTHHNVVDES